MRRWETSPNTPGVMKVVVDGHSLQGRTVGEILKAYRTREAQLGNRLHPGWEDKVWMALKEKYPGYIIEVLPQAEPGVSVASAWEFIQFLLKRLWDKTLVSDELAEKRMEVCRQCPKRSMVLGCHICKDALESSVKPPRRIEGPTACKACLCYLPLKVWVPRRQLGASETFRYDPGCWMISEESPASGESQA